MFERLYVCNELLRLVKSPMKTINVVGRKVVRNVVVEYLKHARGTGVAISLKKLLTWCYGMNYTKDLLSSTYRVKIKVLNNLIMDVVKELGLNYTVIETARGPILIVNNSGKLVDGDYEGFV